jgi:hypothetical protein
VAINSPSQSHGECLLISDEPPVDQAMAAFESTGEPTSFSRASYGGLDSNGDSRRRRLPLEQSVPAPRARAHLRVSRGIEAAPCKSRKPSTQIAATISMHIALNLVNVASSQCSPDVVPKTASVWENIHGSSSVHIQLFSCLLARAPACRTVFVNPSLMADRSRARTAAGDYSSFAIAQCIWTETLRDWPYAGTICRGVLNAQVSIR